MIGSFRGGLVTIEKPIAESSDLIAIGNTSFPMGDQDKMADQRYDLPWGESLCTRRPAHKRFLTERSTRLA
jgi:hypothetical protein